MDQGLKNGGSGQKRREPAELVGGASRIPRVVPREVTMALRLTQASDYAIRSMLYMASLPEDRVVLRTEVAEAEGIPKSFMAKILRTLVRSGLLRSSRGVHGGFSLAKPASEISLLDIVEAMEGPLSLTQCLPDPEACPHSGNCPASGVWARVQHDIARTLQEATLEALVSTPRRNGRVSNGVPAN